MIIFSALYGLLYLGTNMVHAVTPAFFQALNYPDYMFGVSFACMALTNFLTSPFWGVYASRIGYVRCFMFGGVGYVAGQILFALSTSVVMTAIARLIVGLFVAPFMIGGLLYISTISGDEKRGQYMAYFAAVQTASAAGGYFLGGMMGSISLNAAFVGQAVLCLLSVVLTALFVKEEGKEENPEKVTLQMLNPFRPLMEIRDILDGFLLVFLGMTLCSSFTTYCFDNAFNYYIRDIFSFPPAYNGAIKAAVGIIGMLANTLINPRLARRGSMNTSIAWVFGLGMVLLLALSGTGSIPLFVIFAIGYYMANAIYLPIQQTLSAEAGSDAAYGAFMSIRSLGQMLGGLLAGALYTLGARLPFYASALGFGLAMILSFINARRERKTA